MRARGSLALLVWMVVHGARHGVSSSTEAPPPHVRERAEVRVHADGTTASGTGSGDASTASADGGAEASSEASVRASAEGTACQGYARPHTIPLLIKAAAEGRADAMRCSGELRLPDDYHTHHHHTHHRHIDHHTLQPPSNPPPPPPPHPPPTITRTTANTTR